jgi:hypothetical protein
VAHRAGRDQRILIGKGAMLTQYDGADIFAEKELDWGSFAEKGVNRQGRRDITAKGASRIAASVVSEAKVVSTGLREGLSISKTACNTTILKGVKVVPSWPGAARTILPTGRAEISVREAEATATIIRQLALGMDGLTTTICEFAGEG